MQGITQMKKMDEFFNLPPIDTLSNCDNVEEADLPELQQTETRVLASLSTTERVDIALPTVAGLEMHDSEMDSIATKAMNTYEDLMALGGNVPDMHAGKIFEVAGQMLKTALDAKNSKAEKKLRMIELQLKKIRAEQIDFEQGNGNRQEISGGEFDRNQLLKYLISGKSDDEGK